MVAPTENKRKSCFLPQLFVFCHVELVETSRGSVARLTALLNPRGPKAKQWHSPRRGELERYAGHQKKFA